MYYMIWLAECQLHFDLIQAYNTVFSIFCSPCCSKYLHSGAVITQPNNIQHCIQYFSYWAENKPEFVFTTDTPYLALTGEVWGVYCMEFGTNWLRYNGTTLYYDFSYLIQDGELWDNFFSTNADLYSTYVKVILHMMYGNIDHKITNTDVVKRYTFFLRMMRFNPASLYITSMV